MSTQNIFDKLSREAFRAGINPRTKESRKWFRQRAKDLRDIKPRQLLQQEPLEQGDERIIGSMQMFFYDPKTKATLPYYDKFPLVVVVQPAPKGFYGLNLHYLPPVLRAKMLDSLMGVATSKKSANAKFEITYQRLKGMSEMKYFKPCFKHYLTSHVRSQFATVPAPEWEIATFLPVAQFEKIPNPLTAYKDSRAILAGISTKVGGTLD